MTKNPSLFDVLFNRYEVLLASALDKMSSKHYADAVDDLNLAIKSASATKIVPFLRALSQIGLGNYGMACDDFRSIWITEPPIEFDLVGTALVGTAYCCATTNRCEEANSFSAAFRHYFRFYEAIVPLCPDVKHHSHSLAYDTQIVLALQQGSISDIHSLLDFPNTLFAILDLPNRSLRRPPPFNPAAPGVRHYHRGIDLASLNQHEEAIREYTSAVDAGSLLGLVLLRRAESKSALKDFHGVVQDALLSISHNPTTSLGSIISGLAYASMGYQKIGRRDLALSAIDAALTYLEFGQSLAPLSPESWQKNELVDALASRQDMLAIRSSLNSSLQQTKI